MIRIIIADDHAIVRKGIKQILSDTTDIVVVDEAANGQETLDKISKHDIDVLLLDINMPGKSGIEIIKDIKNNYPFIAILVLTIYPEEQYAIRMIKAGADGYITKNSDPDELIQAIRQLSLRKKYISPSLAEKLAEYIESDDGKFPHERLSNREYQVMVLIAEGKSVKEIAEILCLSTKTINTYRTRILEKMRMKKNAEIIHYAIVNNLIDPHINKS